MCINFAVGAGAVMTGVVVVAAGAIGAVTTGVVVVAAGAVATAVAVQTVDLEPGL